MQGISGDRYSSELSIKVPINQNQLFFYSLSKLIAFHSAIAVLLRFHQYFIKKWALQDFFKRGCFKIYSVTVFMD